MSFEGREYRICEAGHMSWEPVLSRWFRFPGKGEDACEYCNQPFVWYCIMDDTNGDGGEPQVRVLEKRVFEKCNLGYPHLVKEAVVTPDGTEWHPVRR